MKSLKTKMTLIFSITCCCCLLAAMLVMLSIAKNLVNSQNDARMKRTISLYAEKANTWFSAASSALEPMAVFMEQQDDKDAAEIRRFNEQMTRQYDSASDIYSAKLDGTFFDGTGWIPDEGWSCTTREWFKLPIEKNTTVYGDPYVDVISGELVTYIATPYYKNGEIAGVCSMDTYLTELTDIMNGIAEDNDGTYLILLDADKNILLHENENFMPDSAGMKSAEEVLDGGFAVVAGEIKSLAEQTASATEYIIRMVSEIQKEVVETKGCINLMDKSTEECNRALAKTDEVIKLVNKDAVTAESKTLELSASVLSLEKHTDLIVGSISSVSAASEEVSASGNEINERAQAQRGSMDMMAASVQELLKAIEDLNRLVGEFRLTE